MKNNKELIERNNIPITQKNGITRYGLVAGEFQTIKSGDDSVSLYFWDGYFCVETIVDSKQTTSSFVKLCNARAEFLLKSTRVFGPKSASIRKNKKYTLSREFHNNNNQIMWIVRDDKNVVGVSTTRLGAWVEAWNNIENK